jgi:histidinol dehydrogenase
MRILKLTPETEAKLMRSHEGEDRAAQRVAARIVADIRRHGDTALNAWSRKLDRLDLKRDGVWVSRSETAAAKKSVSREFLRAVAHAAANVRRVAEQQMPREWSLQVERGVRIGQLVRPIESIGCYIPGGRFALVSTLVMTVVPARVAGVRRIVAVSARANDELLAAADLLGVTHLARIGGAQAIAALAYGTKRIARVDKIFGPGNRYVTAAKQMVSADCAIDLPAGPTEAIVLADHGNARWIAGDLLAQAEHAPDAGSYLVTTSRDLALQVQREVAAQLKMLPGSNPRQEPARFFWLAHGRKPSRSPIALRPSIFLCPKVTCDSSSRSTLPALFSLDHSAHSHLATTPAAAIMFCRREVGLGVGADCLQVIL